MPKIIRDIDQGTEDWFKLRLGSIGGTAINSIMPKGKGRSTLLYQLAGELITGEHHSGHQSPSMLRGKELEAEARNTFEFITGFEVEQVALIKGDMPHTHISPDGIVGSDNSLLEIKCFEAPNHARYLHEKRIVEIKYHRQTQWGLAVSEKPYGWFFAYHPLMKPLKLKVEPDHDLIKEMKIAVKLFVEDLLQLVEKIK